MKDRNKTKERLINELVEMRKQIQKSKTISTENKKMDKKLKDDLRMMEIEREKLIAELQESLMKVKTLSGLVPICASCKKIRDDQGYWNEVETYVSKHSLTEFSYSICPNCMKKLYPREYKRFKEKGKIA